MLGGCCPFLRGSFIRGSTVLPIIYSMACMDHKRKEAVANTNRALITSLLYTLVINSWNCTTIKCRFVYWTETVSSGPTTLKRLNLRDELTSSSFTLNGAELPSSITPALALDPVTGDLMLCDSQTGDVIRCTSTSLSCTVEVDNSELMQNSSTGKNLYNSIGRSGVLHPF